MFKILIWKHYCCCTCHLCTALNVNALFHHGIHDSSYAAYLPPTVCTLKMAYEINRWMGRLNVQFLIRKDNSSEHLSPLLTFRFQTGWWGGKQLPMGLTLMRKAFCKWATVWNSIKCENKPAGWQLNWGSDSGKHTKC